MMESPTFNEASLRRPTEARTRIARDLFDRIDKLEMSIQFFELAHGKRKEPPRDALLKRFDE